MRGKSTDFPHDDLSRNDNFFSRKRALSHIARASERYFSDEPKVIADIEELELEYLFK